MCKVRNFLSYLLLTLFFFQTNTPVVWGTTPIHKAILSNQIAKVRVLIRSGKYDINAVDKNKMTSLHIAAAKGSLIAIQELINKGAHINARTKNQRTPLYIAAKNGHTNCVQELISAGANIHIMDKDNKTALYVAAQNGKLSCIEKLIKVGAHVNTVDKRKLTPLTCSCSKWTRHLCKKTYSSACTH